MKNNLVKQLAEYIRATSPLITDTVIAISVINPGLGTWYTVKSDGKVVDIRKHNNSNWKTDQSTYPLPVGFNEVTSKNLIKVIETVLREDSFEYLGIPTKDSDEGTAMLEYLETREVDVVAEEKAIDFSEKYERYKHLNFDPRVVTLSSGEYHSQVELDSTYGTKLDLFMGNPDMDLSAALEKLIEKLPLIVAHSLEMPGNTGEESIAMYLGNKYVGFIHVAPSKIQVTILQDLMLKLGHEIPEETIRKVVGMVKERTLVKLHYKQYSHNHFFVYIEK